jgi:hypothetical protein
MTAGSGYVMSDPSKGDDDRQTDRRRDDALRRALAMPPQKHKDGEPERQARGSDQARHSAAFLRSGRPVRGVDLRKPS